MIEKYPGIESLLEDPPEARDDLIRIRWAMVLYDPRYYRQGQSTCRCRVCGVTGLDYYYEMEPRTSKKLAEDAQNDLKYLLENGEPEEVRRKYSSW